MLKDDKAQRKKFADALRRIPDGPIASCAQPKLSVHGLADAIEHGTPLGQQYCDLLERTAATLGELNGREVSVEEIIDKMSTTPQAEAAKPHWKSGPRM
jgi:hypothetical protein